MKVATRRLLEEQIAAVVVPGRGEKNDAMWHVRQVCRPFAQSSSLTVGRESWLMVLRVLIPIISGVPQGSVFCPLQFILYTDEMFELAENKLFAYADDSTLLAVVRKPADRPAVAASVNRDLARIQESILGFTES